MRLALQNVDGTLAGYLERNPAEGRVVAEKAPG
jgi:hypothetical protein